MMRAWKIWVIGVLSSGSAACGGASSSADAACAGSNGGASCTAPQTETPPPGCGGRRSWARQPEATSCVASWAECPPSDQVDELWMQFNSLVECQAITCRAGDVQPAGDGCNSCTCASGSAPNLERGYWSCSNEPCGSAEATGKACGHFEGPCGADEYCAFSPAQDCSSSDSPSICMTRPSECTLDDAPVCGCNGTTYLNRCEAAGDGTGIRNFGSCFRPGERVACGPRAGATCSDNEYCAYVAGDACGAADTEGTCRERPAACVAMDAPVCGCDGNTHANACEAAKVGTGVSRDGACP